MRIQLDLPACWQSSTQCLTSRLVSAENLAGDRSLLTWRKLITLTTKGLMTRKNLVTSQRTV